MHNFISADVRKGGDLLKSFEQSNLVNNREKYEEQVTSTSTSTAWATSEVPKTLTSKMRLSAQPFL